MRDPYELLGVSRTASEGEIRDAFRRLAREHHPDRNPGDPQANKRFQEINTAFQILSDPERRRRFDQLGDPSRSGQQPQQAYVNLDELFADLFGGFVAPKAERGDLQRVVDVVFRDAALGCRKKLRYERTDHCRQCGGSGAEEGSTRVVCTTCGGSGQVQLAAVGLFGFGGARPCPRCEGRGRVPDTRCSGCSGTGLASRSREIEITLPPGIENGASQVLRGGGNRIVASRPPGDLELVIRVKPDARFRREADDVHTDIDVPFTTAALGGQVSVETLHGAAALRIAAGTQHGTQLRLKGQGIPHRFGSGRGDHYCTVKLTVPKQVSSRGRELASAFAQASNEAEEGLFDRVRAWFGG